MHLALANGWKDTALFLFHGGGDVSATCKSGKDVMQYAISRGYEQVAREFYFVLQHEAEVKISKAKREAKARRLLDQNAQAAQELLAPVAQREGSVDSGDEGADAQPWGGAEGTVVVAPAESLDASPRSATSSITER